MDAIQDLALKVANKKINRFLISGASKVRESINSRDNQRLGDIVYFY